MSVISRPSIPVGPSKSEIAILQSRNMTATVNTRSGNTYTVLTRPKMGVILINEGKGTGCRIADGKVEIRGGKMFLVKPDSQIVASTTRITRISILTN